MRDIPEKIDSKFRFVLLAATRAEQLMRGAQPKMDHPPGKLTRAGMEEIMADAVGWEYGLPEPVVTEDPEEAPMIPAEEEVAEA